MTYETEAELREEVRHLGKIITGALGDDEQPIERLNKKQAQLVHALEFADGKFVLIDAIIALIYWDRLAPNPSAIRILIHHIRARRPDIGDRIESKTGYGYRLVAA